MECRPRLSFSSLTGPRTPRNSQVYGVQTQPAGPGRHRIVDTKSQLMFSRVQHACQTRRFLTALLGLVLLLAGHVPVGAFAAAADDMACCNDGHACCRRAHRHAIQHKNGPEWRSETCGQSGCCVHPGTTAIAIHADAKPANIDRTIPLAWQAPVLVRHINGRRQLPTNLFQRPPPLSV
jgi:hypothetical protein